MPLKTEIGNRDYYFLPKRIALAFLVVEAIDNEDNPTATRIMEATDFSRAYVTACITGLKQNNLIESTIGGKGGYSLVKGVDETTVGDVLEAVSRTEDRSLLLRKLHRLLIGKAQSITIKELLDS